MFVSAGEEYALIEKRRHCRPVRDAGVYSDENSLVSPADNLGKPFVSRALTVSRLASTPLRFFSVPLGSIDEVALNQ